jgi:hypothetical protein
MFSIMLKGSNSFTTSNTRLSMQTSSGFSHFLSNEIPPKIFKMKFGSWIDNFAELGTLLLKEL